MYALKGSSNGKQILTEVELLGLEWSCPKCETRHTSWNGRKGEIALFRFFENIDKLNLQTFSLQDKPTPIDKSHFN